MNTKPILKIGTSGWQYEDWQGKFYPNHLKKKEWLSFYAQNFSTVEINSTFYHGTNQKIIKSWTQKTPDSFLFAVKAHRYLTHMKKLHEPKDALQRFLNSLPAFQRKLGPILFQLPPGWNKNYRRLEKFIKLLPEKYQYSFEFRNKSWYDQKILNLLQENNIALCIHDHADAPSPKTITADFIYMRFHGPHGNYRTPYSLKQLQQQATKIKEWQKQKRDIYIYFNNDFEGYALDNARTLTKLLS